MINKVNKETYSKVVRELLWQRMESVFWKEQYERQQWATLWWFLGAMVELVILWFILYTS